MVSAMLPRLVLRCVGLAAVLTLCAAPVAEPGLAGPSRSKIAVVYRINFAGLNLGKLTFSTNVSGGSYAVEGAGRLEFLAGVFWKLEGGTESNGAMTASGPRPSAFSFHFENGKKRGKLDMTFRGNAVSDVSSNIPDGANQPRYVPVSQADKTDVLDPLSALFLSAKGNGRKIDPSVCDKRVPVFDGKHRFDIQLSHKQTVRVKPRGGGSYGGPAVICRVKYIPISGYKKTQEAVRYLSASDEIEAWLIPVSNGVYLPYHIRVPTYYGPATATAALIEVKDGGAVKTVVRD